MADPITWGLITKVKSVASSIKTTVESTQTTVDTLPEKVEQKLDPVQTDMAQLAENVQKQVDELREIVENSPAGIPAPPLASMSAQSTENGIEVTYQAALLFGRSSNNFVVEDQDNLDQIFSVTKGVMIRYSNESYPLTPKDGNLAIIDEDIFTLNADTGIKTAKQKTYEIVGLTNNETYYISAFSYNSNYAYQEAAGQNHKNRVKCQWTGTKGTLTVNVTQDYDYKPLGEYTATMTPKAGGSAITKTQSGAATVVFSGLEAGEYTLSFSAPQYFTAPKSQNVTVVAGQSQTISAKYIFTVSLNNLSWSEINSFGDVANKIFSVGDTKTETINDESLTFEIIGFNIDNLTSGGKAPISFGCKNVMDDDRKLGASGTSYIQKSLHKYLNTTLYEAFPEELKNSIKDVDKLTGKTNGSTSWSGLVTDSMKLFLFSDDEIGLLNYYSEKGEGTKYPIYTKSEYYKKTKKNGSTASYWLRSPSKNRSGYFCYIDSYGDGQSYTGDVERGVCFGFCI